MDAFKLSTYLLAGLVCFLIYHDSNSINECQTRLDTCQKNSTALTKNINTWSTVYSMMIDDCQKNNTALTININSLHDYHSEYKQTTKALIDKCHNTITSRIENCVNSGGVEACVDAARVEAYTYVVTQLDAKSEAYTEALNAAIAFAESRLNIRTSEQFVNALEIVDADEDTIQTSIQAIVKAKATARLEAQKLIAAEQYV